VGDDDQTLYAFRASDVRYILEFTKKYLAATVHVLDRNYRSCPDIVLAAKRLIRHNRIRFDKDYQPALAEPGELVIRGYSSPEVEARQVGREGAPSSGGPTLAGRLDATHLLVAPLGPAQHRQQLSILGL
jgi:superfamily I DNA/RNA helicase